MDQLPSDSHLFSQAKEDGGDGAADIRKQLSDRVDLAKLDPWQMEDLLGIDRAVAQGGIESFEKLMATTEGERGEMYSKLAAGEPCLLRVLIAKEQRRTRTPKAALPQFPGLK